MGHGLAPLLRVGGALRPHQAGASLHEGGHRPHGGSVGAQGAGCRCHRSWQVSNGVLGFELTQSIGLYCYSSITYRRLFVIKIAYNIDCIAKISTQYVSSKALPPFLNFVCFLLYRFIMYCFFYIFLSFSLFYIFFQYYILFYT